MKLKLLTLLCALFSFTTVFAQSQHGNEIGIQTDNDSYLGQGSDRYYTDGFFVYFRHALKISAADSDRVYNKVSGFEFGQKIFNPQSGYAPLPTDVDRPFAGYLYVGSTINILYKNESNLKLGAQFGIVGPSSKAAQIQTWVHSNFGFYIPSGWQYQIKDDPELNLSAEYNRLLARAYAVDLSLASYGNLGNGFTGAGLGFLFRLGNFNQLYNSVSTQSSAIREDKPGLLHKHEVFFYYKPEFNYVAYDATIQGGLLERHHQPGSQEITLDKNPFVFSNQVGLAFSTTRFTFDIAAIFHTKEVKEMIDSHQWGSVTGVYRFN